MSGVSAPFVTAMWVVIVLSICGVAAPPTWLQVTALLIVALDVALIVVVGSIKCGGEE